MPFVNAAQRRGFFGNLNNPIKGRGRNVYRILANTSSKISVGGSSFIRGDNKDEAISQAADMLEEEDVFWDLQGAADEKEIRKGLDPVLEEVGLEDNKPIVKDVRDGFTYEDMVVIEGLGEEHRKFEQKVASEREIEKVMGEPINPTPTADERAFIAEKQYEKDAKNIKKRAKQAKGMFISGDEDYPWHN